MSKHISIFSTLHGPTGRVLSDFLLENIGLLWSSTAERITEVANTGTEYTGVILGEEAADGSTQFTYEENKLFFFSPHVPCNASPLLSLNGLSLLHIIDPSDGSNLEADALLPLNDYLLWIKDGKFELLLNLTTIASDLRSTRLGNEDPWRTFPPTSLSRSIKARTQQCKTIWLGADGDVTCDLSGATSNLSAALTAAMGLATSSNLPLVEIRIPPGATPRFEAPCILTNLDDDKQFYLIGGGRTTELQNDPTLTDQTWLHLGAGGSRNFNLHLQELVFHAAGGIQTAKYFVEANNIKDYSLLDVGFIGAFSALGIGVDPTKDAASGNSAGYGHLDIWGSSAQPGPFIDLGSFGTVILHATCGRFNGTAGTSGYFIRHARTDKNGDGLYVYAPFTEGFAGALSSTGKGIVNVQFLGGNFDRATTAFFNSVGISGAQNDRWEIANTHLLGRGNDCHGLLWDQSLSENLNRVKFAGNEVNRCINNAVLTGATAECYVSLLDNDFISCADGVALLGIEGGALIGHNSAFVESGFNPWTYDVNWIGGTLPRRKYPDTNLFVGGTPGGENGTM